MCHTSCLLTYASGSGVAPEVVPAPATVAASTILDTVALTIILQISHNRNYQICSPCDSLWIDVTYLPGDVKASSVESYIQLYSP